MKFMKLGSKPDTFQVDGNNIRLDLYSSSSEDLLFLLVLLRWIKYLFL